jgi:energy-coupling factor transporter ATP-binding protein EcfA2
MRIRNILFEDFRCFRGRRIISFIDPLTERVRDVTVIAGTNGSGKTTILDAIEALLGRLLDGGPSPLLREAERDGLIWMNVELTREDLYDKPAAVPVGREPAQILPIAVGREGKIDAAGPDIPEVQDGHGPVGGRTALDNARPLRARLKRAVSLYDDAAQEACGGIIYFPDRRWLGSVDSGPIEPPPPRKDWLWRYSSADAWHGSLEQLWVWQNYLDLEEGSPRKNLKSFVESTEYILGEGRHITIEKGRVWVDTPWGSRVHLQELPSGEQQMALFFGELARQRRKGGVLLIDEPEISLHPTLQRQFVFALRKFILEWDMQLIMATHSLEIIRSVHEPTECIFLDELVLGCIRA